MMSLKKIFSVALCFVFGLSAAALSACAEGGASASSVTETEESSEESGTKEEVPVVCGVEYAVGEADDVDAWTWENRNAGGVITNRATTRSGIVRSPYFGLTVNGTAVSVYAERTAAGAHSFAYVDLDGLSDGARFSLDVRIETHVARSNPVVLPESADVTATVSGKSVSATLSGYGTYTFTFDRGEEKDGSELPLTLMVRRKEKTEFPADYARLDFEPGTYTYAQTRFTQENTVYYFKKGYYTVEGMTIPSDSVFYFEEGTVLAVKALTYENGQPVVSQVFSAATYAENVKFLGRPAIDFSGRNGSNEVYAEDADADGGHNLAFSFDYAKNVEFAGINVVNSGSWTCCFSSCENVIVRDLLVIGYRTYSDGVMVSDSKDVTVSGCFVRTGDDALEVKSTTAGHVAMENVVFEYNDVWTDKGIAYGAVYETNNNRQGVTWRHNSVGYALANWSDHLGCTTISMQGNNDTTDSDLRFEDIEIYVTYCPVTTIVLENGGEVKNIYFSDIRAKHIELRKTSAGWYRGPIDLIVRNKDGGPIDDFSIKTLYFDNVDLAGTPLTAENKKELITTGFAEGFDELFGDYRFIRVNTLSK